MIEKIAVVSCIVFAIWYSMKEDEIFESVGDWLYDHLPEKLHSPFFSCPVCMSGIYGVVLYWIIWHGSVKEWLIVNIGAIGLNAIIDKLSPPKENVKKKL